MSCQRPSPRVGKVAVGTALPGLGALDLFLGSSTPVCSQVRFEPVMTATRELIDEEL